MGLIRFIWQVSFIQVLLVLGQDVTQLHTKSAVPWLRNLPRNDPTGRPYPRQAIITLVTQGGCLDPEKDFDHDRPSRYGYIAGAFVLLESLRAVNTTLRTIIVMTTDVNEHEEIAAEVVALGHEAALLPSVHDVGALAHGLSSQHRPHHYDKTKRQTWNDRTSRWYGKYTTIHLWARKDLFDTVIFMDSDHIVVRNIDHLVNTCASAVCAVNDPTQANGKDWDDQYFNSGMLVLHPNEKDYRGLLSAFVNNSLTNKKPGSFDPDSFFSKNQPYNSFFTKSGSLYEQDLYNAYFWNQTTYLSHGYNMWARKLDRKLEPGFYFQTAADIEKFVTPRLFVIHGVLWDKNDGYGYGFPKSLRRLWLEQWKAAAKRILRAGPSACGDGRIERCAACESDSCWYLCIGVFDS